MEQNPVFSSQLEGKHSEGAGASFRMEKMERGIEGLNLTRQFFDLIDIRFDGLGWEEGVEGYTVEQSPHRACTIVAPEVPSKKYRPDLLAGKICHIFLKRSTEYDQTQPLIDRHSSSWVSDTFYIAVTNDLDCSDVESVRIWARRRLEEGKLEYTLCMTQGTGKRRVEEPYFATTRSARTEHVFERGKIARYQYEGDERFFKEQWGIVVELLEHNLVKSKIHTYAAEADEAVHPI